MYMVGLEYNYFINAYPMVTYLIILLAKFATDFAMLKDLH